MLASKACPLQNLCQGTHVHFIFSRFKKLIIFNTINNWLNYPFTLYLESWIAREAVIKRKTGCQEGSSPTLNRWRRVSHDHEPSQQPPERLYILVGGQHQGQVGRVVFWRSWGWGPQGGGDGRGYREDAIELDIRAERWPLPEYETWQFDLGGIQWFNYLLKASWCLLSPRTSHPLDGDSGSQFAEEHVAEESGCV